MVELALSSASTLALGSVLESWFGSLKLQDCGCRLCLLPSYAASLLKSPAASTIYRIVRGSFTV